MTTEKQFGLVGNNLKNTFSKDYFTQLFSVNNLPFSYNNFEIQNINDLLNLIETNTDLFGLNITIPFKQSVIPLLNELDETAAKIDAVNCIKITRENNQILLKGYNTDAFGFEQSLVEFIPQNFKGKALILGTGGASKAVQFVCKQLGIDYTLVTSQSSKVNSKTIRYYDLNDAVIVAHKLVINCTPVGMYPFPNDFPEIPYFALSKKHYCFDLIYLPQETQFLKQAKEYGAKTTNGLKMLNLQAEKAFDIFVS
ncbi:MAG: shikimate dehydrogenase family protein [Bacteroidia bacterium]